MNTPAWKKVAVIGAVVILPLIYSFFYLYAFWDPYSKLNELPVAVVNNDVGAQVAGEFKNIGKSLVENLAENDDVKWVFTTTAEAKDGMNARKFYATVTIPENFTETIGTVDSTDKMKGVLLYTLEEKRNFLAGQVLNRVVTAIKENVTKEISESITENLAEKMSELPGKLGDLGDGLEKMDNGANSIAAGSRKLATGQSTLNEGISSLNTGLQAANLSAKKLSEGATGLLGGLSKLDEGTQNLSGSMAKLRDGLTGYSASQKAVNESIQSLNGALKTYVAHHPGAASDPEMAVILGGMAKISAGVPQLNGASTQLLEGMNAAATGSAELAAGTKRSAEGMTELSGGIAKFQLGVQSASEGAMKLETGSERLLSGAAKLNSGSRKLANGISDAQTQVGTSEIEAKKEVSKLNGIGAFVSEPVEINENKIDPVPDYGTAFTPYFVSLSIWVGALMMFFAIYLDPKMKSDRLGGKYGKVYQYLFYTGVGIAQALIVAFVLKNVLGLTVSNVPLYYGVILLISLTFVSIMRFLIVQLKDVGKFIAVLWLILQLTACGGTFPMELVPRFFQVINPLMPMTYSVNALREVISGIDPAFLYQNIIALAAMGICFLVLNLGLQGLRAWKTEGVFVKKQVQVE